MKEEFDRMTNISSNQGSAIKKARPSFLHEIPQSRYQLTRDQELSLEKFRQQSIDHTPKHLQQPNQSQADEQKVQSLKQQLQVQPDEFPESLTQLLLSATRQQSVIYSGILKTLEKNLYFSLISLLLNDITGTCVIVTPHQSYLKEKMKRINDLVNWGALNPQVDQQQRDDVNNHLNQGNIKTLFVHPEMLSSITLDTVCLIIFDEAQSYITELGIPNNLWKINLHKIIQDLDPKIVQILIPSTSNENLRKIQLEPPIHFNFESILSENLISKNPLTVSRDENPCEALVSLLRSTKIYKKYGVLVYCNSKSEIESSYLFLVQKGFKCALIQTSTTEQKRQAIFYDFAKQFVEIIFLPCGVLLPEALKHYVNLTVHMNVPFNLETLLYDIKEINPQANSHIFISDNDFINQRNSISSNFVNIKSIDQLFSQLFVINESTDPTEDETAVVSLKVTELLNKLNMSKSHLLQIIQDLVYQGWIKSSVQVAHEILVKINQKEILETNQFIQEIQSIGRRCVSSKNTSDISFRFTVQIGKAKEIMTNLKSLQLQDSLQFQVLEETLYLEVISKVDRSSYEDKVIEMYQLIQRKIYRNLQKFDQNYSLLRMGSFRSLEHMWKQVTIKQSVLKTDIIQYLKTGLHPEIELPFLKMQSQREKSNLIQDVKHLVDEIMEGQFNCNSWIEKESFITDVLIVLQSLKNNSLWTYNCRSMKVWNKYQRYKYETLQEIIGEWFPRNNQLKKVKL